MLSSHHACRRFRPGFETLEDRLPPGDLLFSSGWGLFQLGLDRPTAAEPRSVLRLPGGFGIEKGEELADLGSAAEATMPVWTRIKTATAVGNRPGSMEDVAWMAWSTSPARGASPATSHTGATPLPGPAGAAERVNWSNALAALDRSAASFAAHRAGGRSGLEVALSADSRHLAISARAPLAFDPASGSLAIWGQSAGEPIREAVTPGGFLEVHLGPQMHSSDPASAWFDPALAGAGRNSLSDIRVVGNGGHAPLLLASQTLSRGLTVQAQGPVTVLGTLHAAGPVGLAAPAITVRGQLDGPTVDLASAGLVNVTATGRITASQVVVTAGVFLDAGQVRADGFEGGQISVQAGNVLQGGRLSAEGTADDGGTVQVRFGGAYIATATAITTADGAHGGRVRIDGGSTGRLFSSGTQEALGWTAAGGLVTLEGKQVVLAGATADASGGAHGGTVAIGSGGAGAETVTMAATTLRAAALDGGRDGEVTIGAARTAVQATSGFHLVNPHPTQPGVLGFGITPLPNGNMVLADPYDDLIAADGGAVYLFQGQTGALLGSLVGSEAGDRLGDAGDAGHSDPGNNVGQGIVPLTNGNYVVRSPNWNGGLGAATWADGTVGITGAVDDTNSLVGAHAGDQVGGGNSGGVVALSYGNYVVRSPSWNNGRGAATWGDGTAGVTGVVDDTNSLVGSNPNDVVGSRVTALANGNYIVSSLSWNGGRGEATWGDGSVGVTGVVDATNSLVGSTSGDQVGYGVTALPGGNYVVTSPFWNGQRGAVTWSDGTIGATGVVGADNSLVGTSRDQVGHDGITILSNGNYVVVSPAWNGQRGAVTWADGSAGVTGAVGADNSLVGSTIGDQVGSDGVAVLSNGNYVVRSSLWNGERGAVTWADGTVGITGTINATNSLVGSTIGDEIGFNTTALTNGNYVIGSPQWNGARGAVTWADGTAGISGTIDATNSLVGSDPQDVVGSGIVALSNGNYVVRSLAWNDFRGAATWGDGSSGITGVVGAGNSLVGTDPDDHVGINGIVALSNGNYVVLSDGWNGNRGAATWGDGSGGVSGMIDASNSLVGSAAGDRVGFAGATVLSNGNYVVNSPYWNGGQSNGRGAVTWGDGTVGVAGVVDAGNSLVGSHVRDFVGNFGATVLSNGNYVVNNPLWEGGRGAVAWGDGTVGLTGIIDASNSLVGLNVADVVGNHITALANGNYVVSSPDWNGGFGAATWGDGTMGVIGATDAGNSLVGSNPGDRVSSSGVAALSNGNYVVASPSWDGGRGAATWGDATVGITGAVDDTNSLVG
jgi:hypothetical protein